MNLQELATEWIEAQKLESKENQTANPPAIDAVIALSIDSPEECWMLILEILSRKNLDEDVIDSLGAGPLEDLISDNGEAFFERIKAEVNNNEELASAMKYVWLSEEVRPSVQDYVDLGCQFVSAK